jgi:F-type H+-transporting ATPase subunit epsilon
MKAGEVRIKVEGESELKSIFVSGGILEIQPHVVTILADTGIRAHDLDEAKATEAKQRAEEALKNKEGDVEYAKAKADLLSAVAQLEMLKKIRKEVR